MNYITSLLINSIILLIRIYQNTFSLLLPSTCKFSPSCSQYMIITIKKYGLRKGGYMGIKQILSCHPYSNKNLDPLND